MAFHAVEMQNICRRHDMRTFVCNSDC